MTTQQGEDAVIDLVVTQDMAKTYSARAVLADLGASDFDYSQAEVEAGPPVRIMSEEGKIVGFADVYLTTGATKGLNLLVADLFLDYATPERFEVEYLGWDADGNAMVFARPVGSLKFIMDVDSINDGFMSFRTTKRRVRSIRIDHVVLANDQGPEPCAVYPSLPPEESL